MNLETIRAEKKERQKRKLIILSLLKSFDFRTRIGRGIIHNYIATEIGQVLNNKLISEIKSILKSELNVVWYSVRHHNYYRLNGWKFKKKTD